MSAHRAVIPRGRHAVPEKHLTSRQVWYVLGIGCVVFWGLIVLMVVLL